MDPSVLKSNMSQHCRTLNQLKPTHLPLFLFILELVLKNITNPNLNA